MRLQPIWLQSHFCENDLIGTVKYWCLHPENKLVLRVRFNGTYFLKKYKKFAKNLLKLL